MPFSSIERFFGSGHKEHSKGPFSTGCGLSAYFIRSWVNSITPLDIFLLIISNNATSKQDSTRKCHEVVETAEQEEPTDGVT